MTRIYNLCILAFYVCSTPLLSQTDTLCPNVLVVDEQPIPSGEYQAFYGVWSSGYVESNSKVDLNAGEQIILDPGFEVQQMAMFHAYIEGCEEDCVESLPICTGDPCDELDFELDERGRPYARDQIIVSYHKDIEANPIDTAIIKHFLDQLIGLEANNSVIRECTCGSNILIYESNVPIDEESSIVQGNTSGGPNEEGIYFGINYYVQPDILDISNTTAGSPGMNQNELLRLGNSRKAPIVAFLDSGIDYNLLPDGILLEEASSCFNGLDTYGWNFVDNNNNIFDNRGHGTTVVMSYLHTLQQEGIPYDQQRILPVKVLDDCGRGTLFSVICGMYYAKEKGAEIINNSWGLYFNKFQLQETVIDLTQSCNITMVCSAGNLKKDLNDIEHFPSGYSNDYRTILPNGDLSAMGSGLQNVYEVGGLCHGILNPPMTTGTIMLWAGTNFREYMWVEPAIDVQDLINTFAIIPIEPPISCGISGTSFAAPQLTAGILDYRVNVGNLPSLPSMLAIGRNVSATANHFSYTQR